MTRIEHGIVIPAPVEQVFDYAADYRRWSEWFEGVANVKPTTEVERGSGARYAYKVHFLSVSVRVETEIHDFVRDHGWAGTATKGIAHRTRWRFEPVVGGTRFTYTLEYRLPAAALGRMIDSWLVKPQWDRIIAKSLDNLKRRFAVAPVERSL
mgnify:CR=1 FL=1